MYFGLNVEHTNNRIINILPCVNSCKHNYIHVFHKDNIGSDQHIGNLYYEIKAYRHIGKLLYRCNTNYYSVISLQQENNYYCLYLYMYIHLYLQTHGSKWVGYQGTLDYQGSDYTASLTVANPDIISGSGVAVAQYLQALTPR